MKHLFDPVSLMLISAILLNLTLAIKPFSKSSKLGHWRLAARDQTDPIFKASNIYNDISPCSGPACVAVYPQSKSMPCTNMNGTIITTGSKNQKWTILCDVDFFAQDIYPFVLAGSFENCLENCVQYNEGDNQNQCTGFVFAPDRVHLENDCYLKSSTGNMISPSTIHLVGAVLMPQSSSVSTSTAESTGSATVIDKQPADDNTGEFWFSKVDYLGTSTNNPSKQYVSHLPALPAKLATKLLKPGINLDLVTKFPLAADTGSWTESSSPYTLELANLSSVPRLSRDGGKGGTINGTHIFYFCDTSTFSDVEGPLGYMNGFVSSSVAVDVSRNALQGKALELQDPIGSWQDDVGRLRGWIPLTSGEEAFNIAVSGDGYRYAVWPESSFIPLNDSHSLIYAPLVYVQVNMTNQHAEFTSLGNTLIVVSVDPIYGPHADRVVNQLFTEDEVEWGSVGGIRAWGKSGFGGTDGMLYLFGQVEGGVLLAKVAPSAVADRSSYTYWNGSSWSSKMPGKDSTAYMVDQPVMDMDLFYAPLCQCFMMIYLTPFADNTFYIRKLQQHYEIPAAYMQGGSADYVENILHMPWGPPVAFYKPPLPASGYIYAAGVHLGYYGAEDVANGGKKLLITWTEHTDKDPNDPSSGYAHKSITLDG